MGENRTVIRWTRGFRADYAVDGRNWCRGRFLDVLHSISPSVHPPGKPPAFRSMTQLLTTLVTCLERFYGFEENKREVDMDMREMVDKVKRNEPLYGLSTMTPYMQGVASRNSRYSGVFLHVIPWFNFVNHEQVCCVRSCTRVLKKLLTIYSMVWTRQSIISKRRGNWRLKGVGA
jgi:hypothetical protein